jgi:hypothetical protein
MGIVVKSQEEQIVMGPVYVPDSIDSHGESMTAESLKEMAYEFLMTGKVQKIDIQHNFEESGCKVVESFIVRKGDPDFKEGTWVLGVKITDTDTWEKVKKGELNGFSFAGPVLKETRKVLVEVTESVKGMTEMSTIDSVPSHFHDFFLKFNDDGMIKDGKTSENMGHWHVIRASDSTEKELDHAHRIKI